MHLQIIERDGSWVSCVAVCNVRISANRVLVFSLMDKAHLL